jgi:hypothetical protein
MSTGRKILFNHIPKTGGVTLRIILNRVYGTDRIFLINSTHIGESLDIFSRYSEKERDQFIALAGHGAGLFTHLLTDPFRVSIVREPVSLFLSQYFYLKTRKDSGFYEQVHPLQDIEHYIDFAIENGQDNLLTRYLSNSIQFLADPGSKAPEMRTDGDRLHNLAINALHEYDSVIDLADFDAGIYALAKKLGWRKIPVYRPANKNKSNPGKALLTSSLKNHLEEVLKYDIALYKSFRAESLGSGLTVDRDSTRYRMFSLRQKGIRILAGMTGKQ